MRECHSTKRGMQRTTHQSLDDPPPPGHLPPDKTTTQSTRAATVRTIAMQEEDDDPKGRRGRPTVTHHSTNRATQPRARYTLDDPPSYGLTPPATTTTPRLRSKSTMTWTEDQTNSPTLSRVRT